MTKIKNFNEYDKNVLDDNERESMENELNYRKISRFTMNDNDVSIHKVIKKIMYEINNNIPHKLTKGNRIENIDGSIKSMLHIEYESPTIGRVRIFSPLDNARKGYFEYNNRVFKEDISIIRNFYIELDDNIK